MSKYMSVPILKKHECGYSWWVPEDAPKVIEALEKEHPKLEFVQFVTSPGNGGYREYALMKLKEDPYSSLCGWIL